MNAPLSPVTATRHPFTRDDVLEMIAQGLVDQRVQLLDGDIHDMPGDGYRHQKYAMGIGRLFMRTLDDSYFVGVQTTLRLSPTNAPSPDIYVLAGALPDADARAEDVLLVIEVADTSLRDNLNDSAARYARFGVREYWVVDVNAPRILIHRDPQDGGYPSPVRIEADQAATPLFVPGVAVRLADIS